MLSAEQAEKDYAQLPPGAQEVLKGRYKEAVELPPGDRTKYRIANGEYQACTLGRLALDSLYYYQTQGKDAWLEYLGKDSKNRTLMLIRLRPVVDRRRVAGKIIQNVVCLDVASVFALGKSQYGSLWVEQAPDWSGMACKISVDGVIQEISQEGKKFIEDSLFFTRICHPCKVRVSNPGSSELERDNVIEAIYWPDIYPPAERDLVAKGMETGVAFLNREVRIDGEFRSGVWVLYESAVSER